MRRCLTCEGLLEDSEFSSNSPICKTCVGKLRSEYHVEYAPPERQTPKSAIVNLILAVRAQAEADEAKGAVLKADAHYGGPMKAWYHNWVEAYPWKRIWSIMSETESHRPIMRSDKVHSRGGNHERY